jgi:hypothetical protein
VVIIFVIFKSIEEEHEEETFALHCIEEVEVDLEVRRDRGVGKVGNELSLGWRVSNKRESRTTQTIW